MQTANEEVHELRYEWRRLAVETAVCAAVGATLFGVAPWIGAATPEVKTAFLIAVVLFAIASLRLAPRIVAALLVPCPRCAEPFHASRRRRAALSLRACGNCGLALRESTPGR